MTKASLHSPLVNIPISASHDAIAERAYVKYLARGGTDGFDLDDWLLAEQELRAALAAKPIRMAIA